MSALTVAMLLALVLAVPVSAIPSALRSLEERSDYGGFYTDHGTDVYLFTDEAPDALALLKDHYHDASDFHLRTVRHSMAELEAVRAAIEAWWDEDAAGLDIRELTIDVRANQVDIGAYSHLSEVREALAGYGDIVDVVWSQGGVGLNPASSVSFARTDRVKLLLALDDYPLVAGDPTWITARIKNAGDTPIRYATDGCEIPVGVRGEMVGETWRPGEPVDVEAIRAEGRNEALDFKYRVKEWTTAGDEAIHLRFVPKWAIGKGDFGCADLRVVHRIAPGEVVEQRLHWDGQADAQLGPPPEGLARITGSFEFRRAGTPGMQSVEVALDVPVRDGRDLDVLQPMEAVDAALADEGFRELIGSVNLGFRAEEAILYDDHRGVWVVGACADGSKWKGNWRAAVVDGTSGELVRLLDRVTGRPCASGPWKVNR